MHTFSLGSFNRFECDRCNALGQRPNNENKNQHISFNMLLWECVCVLNITALEHTNERKTTQSHGTQQIEIILIPIIDKKRTREKRRTSPQSIISVFFHSLTCSGSYILLDYFFLCLFFLLCSCLWTKFIFDHCSVAWAIVDLCCVLLAVVVSFKSFQLIKNMVSVFQGFPLWYRSLVGYCWGSQLQTILPSMMDSIPFDACSCLLLCISQFQG